MKKILPFVFFLLAGCGDGGLTGTTIETNATIISVASEGDSRCIGTDTRTLIETEGGFRARLCGRWGREGETMKGYWTEGHWDGMRNGFSLRR